MLKPSEFLVLKVWDIRAFKKYIKIIFFLFLKIIFILIYQNNLKTLKKINLNKKIKNISETQNFISHTSFKCYQLVLP